MELLKTALNTILFGENEDALLRTSLSEGHPESRVAVIAGDNASGKSFLVSLISAFCRDEGEFKAEPILASMKQRTSAGLHRAFMYGVFGDEADSTGSISMSAVTGLLRTAHSRTTPHWALFDEPDVGLSESYARAMGKWLAGEFASLSDHTKGIVLVTHSKAMVSALFEQSPLRPWFVHMGDAKTAEEWVADQSERTVEELLGLYERSHKLHLAIDKRLDAAGDLADAVEDSSKKT
jgi:hypothetical protein